MGDSDINMTLIRFPRMTRAQLRADAPVLWRSKENYG